MKRTILILAFMGLIVTSGLSQIRTPVKWSVASKKLNAQEAVVFVKATIQDGWHIYGLNVPTGGPESTKFTFAKSKDFSLDGKIKEPVAKSKYEDAFKVNVPFHNGEIVFQQKVKLNSSKPSTVSGSVLFSTCNKQECLPEDEYNFSVVIK
ncbi:protein-disulfide reductase DsbD domain-containing protein [Sphingobacterium tabacisoli]|uniref:Protein-disulfide reductase DsbD domain-containing protein n=1 Tax=Sphingobacterium tabacisoli TaxID=2044855 RepID=A0ABW5KZ39_9SPHI|nr:protein-disulfide reductase DsbD domain-containing protein [Sphingobacterium tabacisoli]